MAFPFDIREPRMNRWTNVSVEVCIQRCFRTAIPQLMRGDVVAVLSHIYCRQMSFKSGVITSRGIVDGVPLGKHLATMTTKDFDPKSPTKRIDDLMAGVSTACRTLGYTQEAAKFTRRCCFSMLDYYVLWDVKSVLNISPMWRIYSWRVCLYTKPQQEVSAQSTVFNVYFTFDK